MDKTIEFGIGFVTGRDNVCNLINNYYKNILEQVKEYEKEANVTFFILYDTNYMNTPKENFYRINKEVYEKINIKYITIEDIEEEKAKLTKQFQLLPREVELILGTGHAKGRNTVMYYALKNKMDYLLFWDDDEYPVACLNEDNKVIWKQQKNVLKHLQNIEDVEITIGYHWGYISPIPYIEVKNEEESEVFKNYIEAISNEIVNWDKIRELMEKHNGITYADPEIADGKNKYLLPEHQTKWVAGSTLCINLNKINKIPAFYNPKGARGEDTFFSLNLNECKVAKIPVYHFHDGFLKYTDIMKNNYPEELKKIEFENDMKIEERFINASIGWIKYKPLLLYINNKEEYKEKIDFIKRELDISIPKISKIFNNNSFYQLIDILDKYDATVKIDYEKFKQTNEIWNILKKSI